MSRHISHVAVEGEHAVIMSGLHFCKKMIKQGATLFRSVLNGSFAELNIDVSEDEDRDWHEDDEIEDGSEEEDNE
jgi:hypothetical protein